jgi:hypothetical protein
MLDLARILSACSKSVALYRYINTDLRESMDLEPGRIVSEFFIKVR